MDILFLNNPEFKEENNNSFSEKVKELFVVFLKMMFVLMIVSCLISLIGLTIFGMTKFSFLNEINKLQKQSFKKLPFFFVTVLGPFFEEIIFRLPLNLKRNYVILSLSFLCVYFVGDKIIDISIYSLNSWIKIVPIIFIIIFFSLFLKETFFEFIKENYYKTFYYTAIFSFGLIHIVNFYKIIPSKLIFLCPIFTLPQIVVSFFVGYLRMRNGFIWGCLLHFLYNLIVITFYFLNN